MLESLLKNNGETEKKPSELQTNNVFNPDKRLDSQNVQKDLQNKSTFDPDKRIVNDIKDVIKKVGDRIDSIVSPEQSTYEERLGRCPLNNVEWTGERGDSLCISKNPEIRKACEKAGVSGIEYRDAIPDFSPVAKETVQIKNMNSSIENYFDPETGEKIEGCYAQEDRALSEKWNKEGHEGRKDWTASDVRNYRLENNLTWHECNDMKTCRLVPTDIHKAFIHLGGRAECARRDGESGGKFDENKN